MASRGCSRPVGSATCQRSRGTPRPAELGLGGNASHEDDCWVEGPPERRRLAPMRGGCWTWPAEAAPGRLVRRRGTPDRNRVGSRTDGPAGDHPRRRLDLGEEANLAMHLGDSLNDAVRTVGSQPSEGGHTSSPFGEAVGRVASPAPPTRPRRPKKWGVDARLPLSWAPLPRPSGRRARCSGRGVAPVLAPGRERP